MPNVIDNYTCTGCDFHGDFEHDLFEDNLQTRCGGCGKLLYLVVVSSGGLTPTHAELVKRAFAWLKKKRCSIVASELVTGGVETPDVIGWHGIESILVEAKISISDFRADQKKIFRMAGRGMGMRRYYIVPSELLDKILPLLPEGWGLLVAQGRNSVRVERHSGYFENDLRRELLFMSSVIRRIAMREEPLKGINVRCYTVQSESEPRAELFVESGTAPEAGV